MKSEWRVTCNFISGHGYLYQVYRLKDKDAVDHSGNREFMGPLYDEKKVAQKVADELNEAEEAERCG